MGQKGALAESTGGFVAETSPRIGEWSGVSSEDVEEALRDFRWGLNDPI